MALFPKMPAKKPGSNRLDGGGRRDGTAFENSPSPYRPAGPSAGGITITGFGLAEASPTRRVIEVSHGNSGMCAVLENAVLLFASGHTGEARTLLADGIENDSETQLLPLAWLALFDLHQRSADRAAFEQLALSYVVRFERSAPTWNDRVRATTATPARAPVGGFINVIGKLSAASATQLEALKRAIERNASQARFDLAAITDFDDAGARLLATVLGEARRKQYPLRLQRPEHLRQVLDAAVKKGASGGEGAWLLSLELLQWQGDRTAFDDRAVDYAVTFEVSPPSWEPPMLADNAAAARSEAAAGSSAAPEADSDQGTGHPDVLSWSGVVAGPHPAQVAKLTEFAKGRTVLPIDMSEVERVDFVGAGATYNVVKTIEEQGKAVQIFGATPIIRAMLLLIGITPGHFYKKTSP